MTPHAFFKVRHHSIRLLVIMGMIAAGCGVDVDDEVEVDMFLNLSPKAGGSAGSGGDPDTNNGLPDTCLNLPGVVSTIQTLGQGPIANANHYLPAMPNMPAGNSTTYPGCRREILKVVVECALDGASTQPGPMPNQTIDVPAAEVKDGVDLLPLRAPRPYYGRHGLAPAWETRALTVDEQEFVSACVMARTNYYGNTVHILMQGHAPLNDHTLKSQYTYGESIVWGNIFTQTRSMHVCHNYNNGLCLLNDRRICDEPQSNYCGFVNHGDCSSVKTACPISTAPYCDAWPNSIEVFLDAASLKYGCNAPITPITWQ